MGGIYVSLRYIFRYPHHYLLSPFYISVSITIQSTVFLIVSPSLYSFEQYQLSDVFFFIAVGACGCIANIMLTLATRFAMASKVSPLSNLENAFTILSDIFIFQYAFEVTDVVGMVVIIASIFAHIIHTSLHKG